MRHLIVLLSVVALFVAVPNTAIAQDHHAGDSAKATFQISKPLVVGSTTLKPGEYQFQCLFVDGNHVLVVRSTEDGKELARVPCTAEQLSGKIETSDFRSVTRQDGQQALTAVRIKGETQAHRLVLD